MDHSKESNGRIFWRKKTLGKPRSRWGNSVERDAVDYLQIELLKGSNGQRRLETEDRGGHGTTSGRSTIGEEDTI